MLKSKIFYKKYSLILFGLLLLSCSNTETSPNNNNDDLPNTIAPNAKGSGVFEFVAYAPLSSKPVKVFYHIPSGSTVDSPVLFLFHGDNRNASDYRNALVKKAETHNYIVIAPEFSENFFPTGDNYNLGNVFTDGDNPSSTSLNPEDIWTFSIIEPVFQYFKTTMNLKATSYHVIGHSAGAQFAHRLLMFKPNNSYDKIVVSSSGWYTVPESIINFPYGLKSSPLEKLSLSQFYSKKVIVQIGLKDNNPNDSGLRHNQQADAQGLDRLSRAIYFFNFCKNQATQNKINFQWNFTKVPNLDHDFSTAINAASDLIF